MFGHAISKLVNERIVSEGVNEVVLEGGSIRDSLLAQKRKHAEMMGAMQEVKPLRIYLAYAIFYEVNSARQ